MLTVSDDKTAIWDADSARRSGSGSTRGRVDGPFTRRQARDHRKKTTAPLECGNRRTLRIDGHAAAVTSVAFAGRRRSDRQPRPHGKTLGLPTGRLLSLRGHEQEVTSVDFRPRDAMPQFEPRWNRDHLAASGAGTIRREAISREVIEHRSRDTDTDLVPEAGRNEPAGQAAGNQDLTFRAVAFTL